MKNTTFRVASLTLCSILCLFASPALAGWGSSGGYYGGSSGGSYGSSGSVAYYSSYGSSGGSHGHHFTPVRSVLRGISNHIHAKIERHQARRAYYGSSGHGSSGYGSSGYTTSYGSSGYSTSYGSSGYSTSYGSSGYSTSYGSSGSVSYGSTGYGSTGASYGSTGTYGAGYGSTGTVYYGASNSTSSNPVFNVASSSTVNDAVYLTVNVPSNAKVYVNDKLTSSTGSVRQFVSRGLASGKTYKFDVRAELVTADGQVVTENKSLVVGAGADEQLQFAFSDTKAPVNTALTLNVPEGAKVTLAGNTTKATGSQRTFQSSHLKLGEAWDDYVVEVEHEGNVKRQAIRLIGGDQLALTFDFEQQPDRVASR